MLFGLGIMLWLLPGPRHIGTVELDIHTMLYAFAAVILGFQSILFSIFTKIFTVSEGSVNKYLEPSISLASKYNVSPYLKQTLELTKRSFETVFGKDKEKQSGLGQWFG